MAMRPDEIAAAEKAAKEAEKKIKVSESGKSVKVDDIKYTDLHNALNRINGTKK